MNKTTDGRFRTVSEAKFINNFGILDEEKYNIFSKKLEEEKGDLHRETAKINQI